MSAETQYFRILSTVNFGSKTIHAVHVQSAEFVVCIHVCMEGLNTFNSTNLTHIFDVDQDQYMFCLHEGSLTYRCIISIEI